MFEERRTERRGTGQGIDRKRTAQDNRGKE